MANPHDFRDSCGVGFIVNRHNHASHDVIEKAFEALKNLCHRGAVDADGRTGDGAGILCAIPKDYFFTAAKKLGYHLNADVDIGVAMVFYPADPEAEKACEIVFKSVLDKYNIEVLWDRDVPVNLEVLGNKALNNKPIISQKILACPRYMTQDEFEQLLFLVRKEIEALILDLSYPDFYIPSMSSVSIIYKGLFMGTDLKDFYRDLQDEDFISPYVVFHQRFSTNTFPTWSLAQPFRMMAHNGEINTINGNRRWMRAREYGDQPKRSWVPSEHILQQFMMPGRSDSGSFDNALETYVFGGRSVIHAIVHMMPEAWQNHKTMDDDLKAFYEYHACLTENWDGPAAISFTDGHHVGAIVDRNGLRPARYKITKDYLFVCSEVGCVSFPEEDVEENGKLKPGEIIAFNLRRKKILKNDDIKLGLADQKNYKEWIKKRIYTVNEDLEAQGRDIYAESSSLSNKDAYLLKRLFCYTQEDIDLILHPMFKTSQEPTGSMGDDTPLAIFARRPKILFHYFKQLFAQVTNPPLDPLRERHVTSLRMYLGKSGNIFQESPEHAHQIRVRGPIVTGMLFNEIISKRRYPSMTLSTSFPVAEGPGIIDDMVMDLCVAAERAIDSGNILIVISDRYVSANRAPVPILLAVSAVHQHLIRVGKRLNISLLAETAEARDPHHFACLIGYGASVIYPYLALDEAVRFAADPQNNITPQQAVMNYIRAIENGILKIMSKMGISVLQAYHAAQLFEAVGLNSSVVDFHFSGTQSKISGADLRDIAEDYLKLHHEAYHEDHGGILHVGGYYRFKREGEYHAFNPEVVSWIQKAVTEQDDTAYKKYAELVNTRPPTAIRDLMQIRYQGEIPIEDVEPQENIIKRFCTPGISYGAISPEAHETFAIAMNRLGAKSNSGEGGEDPHRYQPLPSGDSRISAIKQVASGRFGVTAEYLTQARELEIKIAQGAKPGEGGQLPGFKVSEEIARIRHATRGVTLISPPPHHDIYSIEDLAQLIYDLKQINPLARVCVKLVSEDGIGTIAAGVVKAHADIILISGFSGGTGAAPLTSIKNAGLPWELGLAEAQQILIKNNLRDRVMLRVDGGLKTGADIVKAAILGAEEFGFGTLTMIAVGCVMVRQCHKNTCPVGVATQDPKLRAKYKGTPERVINLFHYLAADVRGILAKMGMRSLPDIIGRVDLLQQVDQVSQEKHTRVRLSRILNPADMTYTLPRYHHKERNDWQNDHSFDEQLVEDFQEIITSGKGNKTLDYTVHNTHRSIGARLSHEIIKRHGASGLPQGNIMIRLTGTVGQSFGVFCVPSIHLHLEGEANDYVGKGLSGGTLTLKPHPLSRFKPEKNIICGNTCLYGATNGKLFVNGRAGERFAVRNSGAMAVVEGVDNHACEYMTGGYVLILGDVGENFGAGMTGGIACVYDPQNILVKRYNPEHIELFPVDWESAEARIFFSLLEEHSGRTQSPHATRIRNNWELEKQKFVRVVPKELLALGLA